MARVGLIQATFASGELSPRLHGRVDITRYQSGAETVENFLVRPEGGLIRRPGTRFAGNAKSGSVVCRLVPFQFNADQAYILEFGNQYMRVWKDHGLVTLTPQSISGITKASTAVVTYSGSDTYSNGDRVLITGVAGMTEVNNREFTVANVNTGAKTFELSGVNSSSYGTYTGSGTVAEIYEIATPYLEADLPSLSWAQSADVLYLRHPSYARRTLSRTGHASWTLSTQADARGPFASLNADDSIRVMCTLVSNNQPGGLITLQSNVALFTSSHVGSYFYMRELYLNDKAVQPWQVNYGSISVGDQVSNDGNVYKCVPGGAGGKTGYVAPVHIGGDAFDSVQGGTDIKKWRYLHSRWAIVKITGFTSSLLVSGEIVTYLCDGLAPSTIGSVTNVTNSSGLFRVTRAAHGLDEGDYVKISGVTGTGGMTAAINNNWKIINVATDTFDLADSTFVGSYSSGGFVRRFATWLWAFGAYSTARGYPAGVTFHEQRLIEGGSSAAPSTVQGSKSGDYDKFLPGTKDDDAINYTIAANQVPVIRWLASLGNALIVGTMGQEFAGYGGGLGDPLTPSKARFVPQSAEGSCPQVPINLGSEVLFINRAKRKLCSLAYSADSDGFAANDLTRLVDHFTTGGKTLKFAAWQREPMRNVWVVRSDGVLLCLTYDAREQVIGWSRHTIGGTGVEVESVASIATPDGTSDELWLSVKRTVNGGTERHIEYLSQPFEPSSSSDLISQPFVDAALEYSGASTSTLTGLWHLRGEAVKVYAGGVVYDKTVSATGSISMSPVSVTQAWVGHSYTSLLKTLRLEGGAVGTAQGKIKRIPRATVRVKNSLGGQVGASLTGNFETLIPSTATTLQSGDFDAHIPGDYDKDGYIIVKQTQPLPLDILCVMPLTSVSEG